LKETGNIRDAIRLYIEQVESGIYPSEEHSFK
ncbi:3-methyl-2-oxobutanoate hydroxymethyltransferase, partial [Xenorhabdus bovienii]|nr:3-methyl-2-oxobutanoate hydroxymethyltransferase [Xenorhabdus bovienii]